MSENIRAMNNYVIVEQATTSAGSIIMKEDNTGIVISCSIEPELVGKTVIFSTKKAIDEYDGYKFVPLEFIMGVLV
tara:strand:+ start:40 stop:267 length:228 start_codon:yes stop_codon:yes gene_type:complete